jgi:hypothetical protein
VAGVERGDRAEEALARVLRGGPLKLDGAREADGRRRELQVAVFGRSHRDAERAVNLLDDLADLRRLGRGARAVDLGEAGAVNRQTQVSLVAQVNASAQIDEAGDARALRRTPAVGARGQRQQTRRGVARRVAHLKAARRPHGRRGEDERAALAAGDGRPERGVDGLDDLLGREARGEVARREADLDARVSVHLEAQHARRAEIDAAAQVDPADDARLPRRLAADEGRLDAEEERGGVVGARLDGHELVGRTRPPGVDGVVLVGDAQGQRLGHDAQHALHGGRPFEEGADVALEVVAELLDLFVVARGEAVERGDAREVVDQLGGAVGVIHPVRAHHGGQRVLGLQQLAAEGVGGRVERRRPRQRAEGTGQEAEDALGLGRHLRFLSAGCRRAPRRGRPTSARRP